MKFLFTAQKLSVQVHPPDPYARRWEGSEGKTEMWHVLYAEAGARLAVGFREEVSAKQGLDRKTLLAAIESGDIEDMLHWWEVGEGETFYVPAGTIHTIGAGLVLCEIQQNSDVTYRLYDYKRPGNDGQPRTLHVEKGLEVLRMKTPGSRTRPVERQGEQTTLLSLAACPYFAAERHLLQRACCHSTGGRFEIWIGLEGEAEFEAGEQRVRCRRGEVIVVPAAARSFSVTPVSKSVFLRTFQPDLEADVRAPLRAQGFSEQQLQAILLPRAAGLFRRDGMSTRRKPAGRSTGGLYGVILAGGRGTRFWPRSRRNNPKQLMKLWGESSLLRQTVERLQPMIPSRDIWVFTNRNLVREVSRQLPEVPRSQIIAEPVQRNTGPCIGLAAELIAARDPEAVLGVFPSDHLIRKPAAFHRCATAGGKAGAPGKNCGSRRLSAMA